ncbi:MAG: GxxExxY protein [Chloroflexota bacterium]
MADYIHKELTEKIIGCFYTVYNKLGYGFLEKVYQRALVIELQKAGLKVEEQKPIKVYYDKEVIGEFFADLIVEDLIIVELKSTEAICEAHENQLINYLKATCNELGLLLNFGPSPQVKRKIATKKRLTTVSYIHDDTYKPNSYIK